MGTAQPMLRNLMRLNDQGNNIMRDCDSLSNSQTFPRSLVFS